MMKTPFQLNIIYKIRRLREENNMSQAEIALMLALSPGAIGNIESPKYPQKYSLAQIEIICKHFNVSIEKLFLSDEDFSSDKDIISLLISKIVEYEK